MAAQEALEAQPDARKDAEAFDGLVSVLRTGGLKTARSGEKHREVGFVEAQRKKSRANRDGGSRSGPRHAAFRSFSSSAVRTDKDAAATLGLG